MAPHQSNVEVEPHRIDAAVALLRRQKYDDVARYLEDAYHDQDP